MWVTQGILILIGLSSGGVIAAGFVSFITSLGIVGALADRTRTAKEVMRYEDAISLGGILGSLLYLYHIEIPFAYIFMPVIGLGAGIFVGCWAMSLAEVINIFPILVRRLKLVRYIKIIVIGIALGKGVGMIILFLS